MDEAMAIVLEVQTLGSGIGGEEDAHGSIVRVGLEGGLHLLAIFEGHTAVDLKKAVSASEAMGSEEIVEPLLCGAVFGENDDTLLVPFAAGFESLL
jgi:hypothetical protein